MMSLSPDEVIAMRAAALGKGATEFWDIAHAVADEFGVSVEELKGYGRLRRISRPRMVVYALARKRGFSTAQIGRWLGGRDHTTILHGSVIGEAILRGEA